jgi:hypothetical protein
MGSARVAPPPREHDLVGSFSKGDAMNAISSAAPLGRAVAVTLAVGVVGCAGTPPHDRFEEFSRSIEEVRAGADAALAENYDWSRERFIHETAEQSLRPEGVAGVGSLLMEGVRGDPFGWSIEPEPLFMASRRFRTALYDLGTVLVRYGDLLAELASPELVTEERFDRVASDLNTNLLAATAALNGDGGDGDLALFSAAASELTRSYLRSRSREALRGILRENQPGIEAVAEHARGGIRLAARHLRHEYEARADDLAVRLVPGSGESAAARSRLVEDLVELDELFVERLAVLRALDAAFQALPDAHRELFEALDNPAISRASIRELHQSARRIHGLSRDLADEPAAE